MVFKFYSSKKPGKKAKKEFVYSYDWFMDTFTPVCLGIIVLFMIVKTIIFLLDMRSIRLEHEEQVRQINDYYNQRFKKEQPGAYRIYNNDRGGGSNTGTTFRERKREVNF